MCFIKKQFFFVLCIKISESNNLTYYQRNRNTILIKQKIIIKTIMKNLKNRQKINIRIYLKKKKIKKENMEKIDIICLKKKSKN